ncbi:Uridylate kinase [Anaerococcus prevotii]|uniref:Uridylate kinase n=1 Tax=Anaerococcus prevotii (strain ATCC 9321 / DSM 20548 / JCM 6508 / NCTC 11806 / PC1) TaxID=525919 RepID=C7RGS4_ANAPD|nr:UMP kinase [Anaerococcus prevotii]ACV28685.1 uridylate kinase [Anaerococcus prevotii DSM 20548]MDU3137134.1 UMP kinase [Anaerococcus prevotii]SUU94248.1 Uridylate kinase [Anaerococcus prevotii]
MQDYKRVILKLSGEALAGDKGFGFDDDIIINICENIKAVSKLGVQIAIVVGGGNFWRGRSGKEIDRASSDTIGMLGTVMNGLRVQGTLEEMGLETRLMTAIDMKEVAEPYIRRRAVRHLEKGRIVIFSAGTGLPYFSTDTTASLRALEINADVILLGKTGTDGIYDKDPNVYHDAVRFDKLTYKEILHKELKIMDTTATSLCMDNDMPLFVFGIDDPSNLVRIFEEEDPIGTIVKESF